VVAQQVTSPEEIRDRLRTLTAAAAEAYFFISDPLVVANAASIIDAANTLRLPTVVEDVGLGTDLTFANMGAARRATLPAMRGLPVELIDLSHGICHRGPGYPSHLPIVIATWYNHSEKKKAGDTVFLSKVLSIAFNDHAGTHVDAPVHFDPRPEAKSIDQMALEQF
jgi:hypothetical protein